MRLVLVMIVVANGAMAEEWTPLDGVGIAKALTARVLRYKENAQQNFFADGRTLYESGVSSWGKWRVDYDQYCSIWPPAGGWTCYDVFVSRNGLSVLFSDNDRSHTEGKYSDLQ